MKFTFEIPDNNGHIIADNLNSDADLSAKYKELEEEYQKTLIRIESLEAVQLRMLKGIDDLKECLSRNEGKSELDKALSRFIDIEIQLDPWGNEPYHAHGNDAGYDLYSPCEIWFSPKTREFFGKGRYKDKIHVCTDSDVLTVDTGVHLAIPAGYEGCIRPRSSMSLQGFNCCVGTVDSGYTGEIKVAFHMADLIRACEMRMYHASYSGADIRLIKQERRFAQIVISPVQEVSFRLVPKLKETCRGNDGFGSSGM